MSTCFGCRRAFVKPVVAPHDLVIQHKDFCGYTAPDGVFRQRYGNVYYHVNLTCIASRQPSFNPSNLVVSSDVTARAISEHNDYIVSMLGVSLY